MATSERSKGKEFPNRSTASNSQNVTERRYQTKSANRKTTETQGLFLFKDNDSNEKFDNDVFSKGDTTKCRGHGTHIGTYI